MTINQGMMSSNKDDWETPDDMFDNLNYEFHFDVDVCAHELNHKMIPYISPEQNGLKTDWFEYGKTVWMNPPYGSQTLSWVKKAYQFGQNGGTAVCLLPSRMGNTWFMDYVMKASEWRVVRGRLKFIGASSSAPFPSMIVIFTSSREPLKVIECDLLGKIVTPISTIS